MPPPPLAPQLLDLVGRALAPCASPALVIARDGRVAAASAGADRLLGGPQAGRAVQEIVGLGWRELALVASEAESDVVVALAVRAPGRAHAGWRLHPDLLRAPSGEELGVVAWLEEPVDRGGVIGGAAGVGGSAGNGGAPTSNVDGGRRERGGRRDGAARRPESVVGFANLFAEDAKVVATKVAAERFARTRLPILLLAETGTGKDLLARAIHGASPRCERPFVAINCGALSPHLLESELFGYAPGAFTDARREGYEGKVGAARGGTLFLDEVAEMPGPLQALLLRVLEDGTYFRVGESVPRQADVRLICATCRDLPGMVDGGSFRRDLYFRIAGAVLALPAVRERNDVANLVRHVFAGLAASENPDAPAPRLSRAVLERLTAARWPGNVRQIRTALQYAMALADGSGIRPEHLPKLDLGRASALGKAGSSATDGASISAAQSPIAAPETAQRLAELEHQWVTRAIREAGGNLSLAARRLGIARSTLYRHLRQADAARPPRRR
ncbi:MAG: sigma-54 dependent transcriptional regulator, acetoin dehydrogenase operon transcriptional [Acidobacteriota bacterium]|nr:sigma-54 dependent transcriptional regulator, acetoin dehydrogenase operon transcriptional [Acidobacteriota bacterium]